MSNILTPSLPLSISIPFCASTVPPSERGSTTAPSTPALVNCFVKCFLNPSLIKLLLPICESGIRVREFIKVYSRYEYGKVSQALASGIRGILREFDLLVAQLEMLELKQQLSLQTLMFHLQPAKMTLKSLDRLCTKLRDTSGGRMLDVLYGTYICL